MPSLFNIFGYKVYFWITQYGGTVVTNYSKIPKKDLVKLKEFIRSNIPAITQAWINIFGSISYYC